MMRWLQEKWRRFNATEEGYQRFNTDDLVLYFWLAVACVACLAVVLGLG